MENPRPSDAIRDFLTSELARTRSSKGDLAAAMNISASALSKILNGTRQVEATELLLARNFFVSTPNDVVERLVRGMVPGFLRPDQTIAYPPDFTAIKDETVAAAVPVVRDKLLKRVAPAGKIEVLQTSPGDDNRTFLLWPVIIDTLPKPPIFDDARSLFAFYMSGASGAPRFVDGDLIVCDLNRPAAIGDYVVAHMNEIESSASPCMIGRLVDQDDNNIRFANISSANIYKAEKAQMTACYRILSTMELLR